MAKRKRLDPDHEDDIALTGDVANKNLGRHVVHEDRVRGTRDGATVAGKISKDERRRRRNLERAAERDVESVNVPVTASDEKVERQSSAKPNVQQMHDEFLQKHSITIVDPLSSRHTPILEFEQLPEEAAFAKDVLKDFKTPTPIQAVSWPFALSRRDVVGIAETGSGKTLAFGLPCIASLLYGPRDEARLKLKREEVSCHIRAVIVSPTRELAHQIFDQIHILSAPTRLNCVCVFGGAPKEPQRQALKTADIVVGTPGRLNDFMQEGAARLDKVTYLVLDEADRMLDKGFEDEIKKIVGSTSSARRQTLMFTATWPQSIRSLAGTLMKDPVEIFIGDSPPGDLRANLQIQQTVEVLETSLKDRRLCEILKTHQAGKRSKDRILIFCLYKKEAARTERFLLSRGMNVAGIHGDMAQAQRTAALVAFKTGARSLLVATDVAARGLDIPEVKLVINVTFPLTVEDYVHRIGRTGRAGQTGQAITFFTEQDKSLSGELINVLRAANQHVPNELLKFGTTVKRKTHDNYGAFYKNTEDMPKATKVVFD
ncbi:MAG: RNA-dependent ATPase [Chrysothrix sp. TS-e1954]|nr:MAG: RNA-dependent ATPase [Chrysothrix sp. TS-e1954]